MRSAGNFINFTENKKKKTDSVNGLLLTVLCYVIASVTKIQLKIKCLRRVSFLSGCRLFVWIINVHWKLRQIIKSNGLSSTGWYSKISGVNIRGGGHLKSNINISDIKSKGVLFTVHSQNIGEMSSPDEIKVLILTFHLSCLEFASLRSTVTPLAFEAKSFLLLSFSM